MADSNDNTTLKRLQVIITGNATQLNATLQQAERIVNNTSVSIVNNYGKVGDAAGRMAKDTSTATGIMQGGLDKVGSILKKVGAIAAAAISVKAIVNFSNECIELGSDLTEVQNVVDVTFGGLSGQVDKFAKQSIKQFGLSETAAKSYTSTMGAMFKSMGLSTDKAYEMSTNLTGLAGDIASFYNLDADEAFAKIRAGISGETEPLKQLGINMSTANLEAYALSQGITKSYTSMSQMEQATLRYNYLLNATADAQGDFARTSDGWANQTRILSMQFDSLKANIGKGLITALTPVLRVINSIIEKLVEVTSKFNVFIATVTGQDLDAGTAEASANLDAASLSAEDVGTNLTTGVEKAEKAAKRFTLDIDEINKLTKDEDETPEALDMPINNAAVSNMNKFGNSTAKDNALLSDMQAKLDAIKAKLQPVIDKAKEMGNAFVEGFEKGSGGNIVERLRGIGEQAKEAGKRVLEIFGDKDVQESAGNFLNAYSNALGSFLGSAASIGTTIGEFVIGGTARYLNENTDRIKNYFINLFDVKTEVLNILSDLYASIADIFSVFGDENGQTYASNLIGIFADAFMGVELLAEKTIRDVLDIFAQPIIVNMDGIKSALDDVLGFYASVSGTIKEAVDFVVDSLNSVYDEHIGPLFNSIRDGVTELVGTFLEAWNANIAPLLDAWGVKIQELWENNIRPAFEQISLFLGSLAENIKVLWEMYIQPFLDWLIKNFIEYVAPVINDIFNILIAVLGTLWDVLSGLFEFIRGAIDVVVGLLTGDFQKAGNGVVTMLAGIGNMFASLWDGIKSVLGGLLDLVWEWLKGMGNMIKSAFVGIVNKVKSVFGGGDSNGDAVFNSSARDASGFSGTAGEVIQGSQLSEEEMYNAFSRAVDDARASSGSEIAIYMDGEKVGEGVDKANRLKNVRLNPVVG